MKVTIFLFVLLLLNFFCVAQEEITGDSPVDSLSYEDMYRQTNQELNETRQILFSTEMELAQLQQHLASKEKKKRRNDIKTLSRNSGHNGGFGALNFKYTEFRGSDILLAGFRGGWIINRSLGIGLEGQGIVPSATFNDVTPSGPVRILGGYGGLFLEPIFWSNEIVHVTFPIAGGAGWLGYHDDWTETNVDRGIIDDDVYWYVEPGGSMEVNVARNFRINLGVTYRFTENLDLAATSSDAFDGFNYFLTLKFGSF